MLSLLNVFKKKYQVSKEIISFEKEEMSLRAFSKNTTELANNLCSLAKASFSKYPLESIRVMMESHDLTPQQSKLKWLAFRLYDFGKLTESYNLLANLPTEVFVSNSEQKKYKKIINEYQYIKYVNTFVLPNEKSFSEANIYDKNEQKNKNTVAHIDFSTIYEKYDNLSFAIVSDYDFYQSLSNVVNCLGLTPFNYKKILSKAIDLLIITPTELGENECWDQLKFKENNEQRKLLINIIKEFNDKGVITVFYTNNMNDQDEVYDCFIKECKYVLSTNQSLIDQYNFVLNSKKIIQLDYLGINPLMFNPRNIINAINDNVFYSGIWFSNNLNRCQILNKMFAGVALSNKHLSILNNLQGFSIEKEYQYPSEYNDCLIQKDQYDNNRDQSSWIINYSKSTDQYCIEQCVRDLAKGYLIISDYSYNIHETLPYVSIVRDSSDVVRLLCRNSFDDLYERRIFSARFIFRNFNIFDNVNRLLAKVDLSKKAQFKSLSILVIGKVGNFSEECFKNQTYANKQFSDESLITEDLIAKYDLVTWFLDDNLYEEFYLEDMVNGFKYSNSDFITKSSSSDTEKLGTEYCYVDKVTDKYKTLFNVKSCRNNLFDEHLLDCGMFSGFCIDHLNFIENYRKDVLSIENSNQIKQYKLSIIIPVFNNGEFLYAKAFASLKMQTKFRELEIVIVDDGSTDNLTVPMIKYLERHYSNVRAVFLKEGGSGSASCPRNEGLKECSGDFVTFLDPDDECLNDCYSEILVLIDTETPNIIIGNNVFSSESETISDNCSLLTELYHEKRLSKDHCIDINDIDFKAIRIQSMVINRAYLSEKNVSFIEHAIGEDSLFSWQILHMAKDVMFTDICMHVYYAKRNSSESNLINSESLEKLYLIQPHKIKWLVDNDLIIPYMNKKFEKYVHIRLQRFLKGKSSNKELEKQIQSQLQRIIRLYKPYYLGSDENILCYM